METLVMLKHTKLVVVFFVIAALMLSATAFSQERDTAERGATARDTSPYTGPTRPFDPKPLMEQLKADPAKQTGPFTFACLSDREWGVDDFVTVIKQIERVGPDFCVMPGDIVHRGAGPDGEKNYNALERTSGWFLAKHPCWPVMGNHEISRSSGRAGVTPHQDALEKWKAFFNMDSDWYTFTYRNNLFVVIGLCDNVAAKNVRERFDIYASRHMPWLEEQLKAGRGMDNIFVFLHRPLVTVGSHEVNPSETQALARLCRKYNITAVIYGHDHVYYRTFRNGVSYICSAGAGGGGYTLDHLENAIPGDIYMGLVVTGKNAGGNQTKSGSILYNPALGLDKQFEGIQYFFPLIAVDGKKVTLRTLTWKGEEIDNAILRDQTGKNVTPAATTAPAISPTIKALLDAAVERQAAPAESGNG